MVGFQEVVNLLGVLILVTFGGFVYLGLIGLHILEKVKRITPTEPKSAPEEK